jgi:hypothetical protein
MSAMPVSSRRRPRSTLIPAHTNRPGSLWFRTPLLDLMVAVSVSVPVTTSVGVVVPTVVPTAVVLPGVLAWVVCLHVVTSVGSRPRPGFPNGLPTRTVRRLRRICRESLVLLSAALVTVLAVVTGLVHPAQLVVASVTGVVLLSLLRAGLLGYHLARLARVS